MGKSAIASTLFAPVQNRATNNQGMTLIEVMVVMSLLSIMAVAATQFFVNLSRQQKIAEYKAHILQVQMMVQGVANNPTSLQKSSTH